jgi:hypothetical protein
MNSPTVPHIFESPMKADPAEVPSVPIYDYVYGKLCAKGMQASTDPWVVSENLHLFHLNVETYEMKK